MSIKHYNSHCFYQNQKIKHYLFSIIIIKTEFSFFFLDKGWTNPRNKNLKLKEYTKEIF